jgi:hypothetical protein
VAAVRSVNEPRKIAVLGWGSLIWDARPAFDSQLGSWVEDGPQLPIEFSRISTSRGDALTLVIDEELGTEVQALYSLSARTEVNEAVNDLRRRESTSETNIGYLDRQALVTRGRNARSTEAIRSWAEIKGLEAVVWTDLPANFPERDPRKFPSAALQHLQQLKRSDVQGAIEYIVKTPRQINTRLRTSLMNDGWFKERAREIVAVHERT